MEISKEFAEKQYLLHKQEADKWSKIVKAISSPEKKRLSKKEKYIIAANEIDAHINKTKRIKQQH